MGPVSLPRARLAWLPAVEHGVSPSTHHQLLLRVVAATSLARHFACASASSPATARPHRSNRPVQALRANPLGCLVAFTRPARPRLFVRKSGASLEVWSPSAQISRAARCPAAVGRRTVPLRRLHPPARARCTDCSEAALALAVFRFVRAARGHRGNVARTGGRSGWVVRSSPIRLRRTFVDRQDAIPVVFDPPDGCGRRNRSARASDDGSSQIERCRLESRGPARVMHRRVL